MVFHRTGCVLAHPVIIRDTNATYNFLNTEKPQLLHCGGTDYGQAGDILTLAFGMAYQKSGAGPFNHCSDFLGLVGDILFRKLLPKAMSIVTVNAEYKQLHANYSMPHSPAQINSVYSIAGPEL